MWAILHESERLRSRLSYPKARYYRSIFREGLRKTTTTPTDVVSLSNLEASGAARRPGVFSSQSAVTGLQVNITAIRKL
jgi:hypothetical protein